jgi:hypothetical protein
LLPAGPLAASKLPISAFNMSSIQIVSELDPAFVIAAVGYCLERLVQMVSFPADMIFSNQARVGSMMKSIIFATLECISDDLFFHQDL